MMEKISRDLGVAKTRKESVMEACRRVNEESSAVMLMCLQFDNLEQHFEGIQMALESCVEENLERERLSEERLREVVVKEQRLREVVAKEQRLGFLQEEIRRKEVELEIAERRVKECMDDCVKKGAESARLGVLQEKVRTKEEELRIVEERVKECDKEFARSRGALNQCLSMLKDREIEINSANRLLQECCEEYDQKKSEVDTLSDRAAKLEVLSKDYALKKDELDSINLDIEKKVIELQAKEKQHEAFQNSINEQLAVFDGKKQEFESLECSSKRITGELQARECELKKATECLKELEKKIESKNEELASVLKAKKGDLFTICCKIDKHNVELAKKENEVECIKKRTRQREEDLQRKEKQAASFRSSIRECLDDLEDKKRQLSCVNESLSRISEEVEFKKRDLEQIRQESMEYHWELEKREKRLEFLQASLDEQCKLLELNERNFLEKVMDFEHRQRQFLSGEESLENLQGVRLTPCSEAANCRQQVEVKSSKNRPSSGSLIKAPASPIISTVGCNTSNDEFVIWKLRGLDPSKEVLDIIEESFERLQSCGDAALRDCIRRCIYLLERLAQHAPPLMDGIKQRALKMAREWELKLRTNAEGRSEVLGFLCLLHAYKLVSYFDRRGITKLAETFSLYKSHPGLCHAIGLADMNTAPPERGTSSSSPRFPLRPHRENKRPLPATDARLQLSPKRRVAPFDRS